MSALKVPGWRSFILAFAIWFVQFMVCWAAAEIWPHRWAANATAWGITGIALLTLVLHIVQLNGRHAAGELPGWHHRIARGAAAIAAAAVLFCALPSIVFLP